jgi:hypothetical protein
MRRLGTAFMALGAVVGVATGLAVLLDLDVPGVGSWLVAVAVAKLGFIASFGLIAAGALMHRMGNRRGPDTNVERITETLEPLEHHGSLSAGTPAAELLRQRHAEEQERQPRP